MPNCVQFIRKSDDRAVSLNKLDEELCGVIGEEVHPKNWCREWFNIIGFWAAMGKTWDEIRVCVDDREYYGQILDHLEMNYNISSWVEIGRR